MHRVGHVVGPVHDLGLQARPAIRRVTAHPGRDLGVVGVETELPTLDRPVPGVLRHRVQRGPGQVQARAAFFAVLSHQDFRLQPGQDAKVLRIALETAAELGDLVERPLTVVPVGRVTDVVCQPGQVDQVGVGTQPDRHTPADLRDLQ